MTNDTYAVAVAEAALDRAIAEAAKAQMREAKAEAMGQDEEYENGTVITWERTFANGVTYSYAAVRSHGVWYLTGRDQNPLSWVTVVANHLVHADSVWLCTEVSPIWPSA